MAVFIAAFSVLEMRARLKETGVSEKLSVCTLVFAGG